jgi:DNA-binding LytR/AlgR family response regulator
MKINCIIVDDEPASREILEKYVADCSCLHLVKICKNSYEAAEAIDNFEIQLIFLDINMPKLSGMKFYRSLINPPFVIFTTAYPEFAVEGFEVNAVDYLLKPFPFDRFLKAVNKATDILKNQGSVKNGCDYIFLRSDKKIYRVIINDISHLEAVGDYVKIFFSNKHIMVHETFQNLLNQLPVNLFVRVHKSHAIAINKIDTIEGNMVRISEKYLPIGETYRAEFMNLIKGSEHS